VRWTVIVYPQPGVVITEITHHDPGDEHRDPPRDLSRVDDGSAVPLKRRQSQE
jgi:hypothetical protein